MDSGQGGNELACSEHGGAAELEWAFGLEPGQAGGRFWCWFGRHYVMVGAELAGMALWVLQQMGDIA